MSETTSNIGLALDEIEERIPAYYIASCEDGGPSFHFASAPGRGKTSLLKLFPRLMHAIDPEPDEHGRTEYGFAYINGASTTLGILCGYQQLLSSAADKSHGHATQLLRSVFSMPTWWFINEQPLDEFKGGLIFVDEKDKMGQEEKKLVADMRLEKRVANHVLPDNWVVWTAGNRAQDRSGSTKELDFEINRTIIINVRDSLGSWVRWARGTQMLPEVINFGEKNSQLLFMDPPKVQGPYCTPRSLAQADIYLRSNMSAYRVKSIPVDMTTQIEIAGGIGKEAAEQLILDIKMGQELPKYDDVIAKPKTITLPGEPDRMRLFAYKMANEAQVEHGTELITAMQRQPNEFQVLFVRMAVQRNARLINNPDMRKWCMANAHLVQLIDQLDRRR